VRKTLPSNYQIFDYWKDKKLPNGFLVIWDWGEPCCWGCSLPIKVETPDLLRNRDFKTIWNRTSGYLERCHIVPRSLGGSNEPSNLFLLCPKCHRASPDTEDPNIFLEWVTYRRSTHIGGVSKRELEEIHDAFLDTCSMYGFNRAEFRNFIVSYCKEVDYELPINISTHATKISPSSLMMVLAKEYMKSKQKEAV
jgi:hypothetical protein